MAHCQRADLRLSAFHREVKTSAVECVDGRNRGLARFHQQLVALKVQAGRGIDARPTIENVFSLTSDAALMALCSVPSFSLETCALLIDRVGREKYA